MKTHPQTWPPALSVSVSELMRRTAAIVEVCDRSGQPFLIMRRNKPVAVLVPLALYEAWKQTKVEPE